MLAYIHDLSGDGDAAAGSDDSVAADGAEGVTGIVRTPAPVVDGTTLPSLSVEGEQTEFRASTEGGVKAVYFGYTGCPDVCPTTMADLAIALRKLPEELAAQVETVFVTVDPDRDLDIAVDYARSFVPDADAAGTLDAAELAAAAEPFGVVYNVTEEDGEIVVEHSPFLYLVNDAGELLVTWQFGETSDNMAADIATFLDRSGAPL